MKATLLACLLFVHQAFAAEINNNLVNLNENLNMNLEHNQVQPPILGKRFASSETREDSKRLRPESIEMEVEEQ